MLTTTDPTHRLALNLESATPEHDAIEMLRNWRFREGERVHLEIVTRTPEQRQAMDRAARRRILLEVYDDGIAAGRRPFQGIRRRVTLAAGSRCEAITEEDFLAREAACPAV